jgi:hypothetical protein
MYDYSINEFNEKLNEEGYKLKNNMDSETAIEIIQESELTINEFIHIYESYLVMI